MTTRVEAKLDIELHDVFHVCQLTRGTRLGSDVGVDLVDMDPNQESEIHRHNLAETVLFFVSGAATVVVEGADHPVVQGNRVTIGKGEFHGVRTGDAPCRFVSVQTPPILDTTTGFRDLEPQG